MYMLCIDFVLTSTFLCHGLVTGNYRSEVTVGKQNNRITGIPALPPHSTAVRWRHTPHTHTHIHIHRYFRR